MGSLHRLDEAHALVVSRRRKATLDRLWDRIQARLRRGLAQASEEREGAEALLAELMGLPEAEQRLETVEREPRFWTLGLAERLLAIAQPADSARALELAELALALVRRLEPQRYEESLLFEQEVVARSL